MIHLELQPELEAQLAAEARASGLELSRYLEGRLTARDPRVRTQAERDQAAAQIRRLRQDNILGDDLTIRDLINEGRKY